MALWKESTPAPAAPAAPGATPAPAPVNAQKDPPPREQDRSIRMNPPPAAEAAVRRPDGKDAPRLELKESVVASDLSIEGKIEGSGHVRIAGKFKGDVRVDGNLTIDQGAQLTGQVIASVVTVAGELHGNIAGAKRVELLATGVIAGDVKAGLLSVAAGSRMRGQVEFGWDDSKGHGSGT